MPKTLLLTGIAGFAGSHALEHVLQHTDWNIVGLTTFRHRGDPLRLDIDSYDPDRIRIYYCDLNSDISNRLIDRIGPVDYVWNLASESHVDRSITDPRPFIENNVRLAITMLEFARLAKPEVFIQISTDEVYGSLGSSGYFSEETSYDPHSPYSASKASSDHLVRAYHDTYSLPVIISNCSNNYGSFQFPEKLIPLAIHNIRNNKPVPVYGKGENIRDWLYVEDHAQAIDLIFHKGKNGETYNIGGNNEWKNIDLIHLLCDIMDRKLNRPKSTSEKLITFVKDRAGHDLRYAIDSSKLQKELGWKPSLRLEQGLDKTVEWYLSNEEWLSHVTSGEYKKYYQQQYVHR